MATQLENEFSSKPGYFQTNVYRDVLKKFRKICQTPVHFHLLFSFIALVEGSCLFFIPLALFAILLFITVFSYIVLLFYHQANKPAQLQSLKDEFVNSCKVSMNDQHLSVAESLIRFSSYLEDFEWDFYKVSSPLLSRFSAYCYWKDVFQIKQMLLMTAVEEHIQQIRLTPTDIEVHASLGEIFVTLSKLYREPVKSEQHPRFRNLKSLQATYEEKSKYYSTLAIEEFKIMSHYASNDPWTHEKLALGYKDLNLPAEETKEIENLLKLKPHDKDILFHLGTLYFAQGLNAKGLSIYEELKKANYKKAEDLISHYSTTKCSK